MLMLSLLSSAKHLFATTLLIILFVILGGFSNSDAQQNGDLRVQFDPSNYEFILDESIDVKIVVQEYNFGRWNDVPLKKYGLTHSDLSISNGHFDGLTLRYGDDDIRKGFSDNNPDDLGWILPFLDEIALYGTVRIRAPATATAPGNMNLTVSANALTDRNGNSVQTPSFTANFNFVNVEYNIVFHQLPDEANDFRFRFRIYDSSSGDLYINNKLDRSDIELTLYDGASQEIATKASMSTYMPAGLYLNRHVVERVGRRVFVGGEPEYILKIPPPLDYLPDGITSGKMRASLKPGTQSGLATFSVEQPFSY